MNTLNHYEPSHVLNLIESIDRYAEAGIDPAFDADYDDLEREFAEARFQPGHE